VGSLRGGIAPAAGAFWFEVGTAFPKNAIRAFSKESSAIAVVWLIWAY
jgi:hypothetical protein